MQNGSTTEKAAIIMQLDIYFFWVGDRFSPPARKFGAKSLWKSMATAATNQINTPCKATDHCNSAFPLTAMTLHYIMEKISRGISRHQLMAAAARDAHWTASKH